MNIRFKIGFAFNYLNLLSLNTLENFKQILLLYLTIDNLNIYCYVSIIPLTMIHFFSISLSDNPEKYVFKKLIIRKNDQLSIHEPVVLLPRLSALRINRNPKSTKFLFNKNSLNNRILIYINQQL